MLIFSDSICKKEGISTKEKTIILKYFVRGIFTSIKGLDLPKSTNLIKIYATTISGARRIVLMQNKKNDRTFFLFYRDKNDQIGTNITIKNKLFRETLKKYLLLLNEDIKNHNIDVYKT